MMNADNKMKWACTFALLAFCGWWGHYTVNVTLSAMAGGSEVDILKVAGANGLLGAVTTLLTLAIQHWFRRAKPS